MPISSPKQQRGLTLLEILIVMSMLGVLTAAGVSVTIQTKESSKMIVLMAEMKAISKDAQMVKRVANPHYECNPTCTFTVNPLAPGGNPAIYTNIDTTGLRFLCDEMSLPCSAGYDYFTPKLNPFDYEYRITVLGVRTAQVSTEVEGNNVQPYDTNSVNVGLNSRLTYNYKPDLNLPSTKRSYTAKKILYCEGYDDTNKPSFCP